MLSILSSVHAQAGFSPVARRASGVRYASHMEPTEQHPRINTIAPDYSDEDKALLELFERAQKLADASRSLIREGMSRLMKRLDETYPTATAEARPSAPQPR